MMQSGANVQIVVSLTDLKEMFNRWQDERDAMKPAEKEDKLLTADEAANLLNITSVKNDILHCFVSCLCIALREFLCMASLTQYHLVHAENRVDRRSDLV